MCVCVCMYVYERMIIVNDIIYNIIIIIDT